MKNNQKSNVCLIANSLSKNGMSRSDSFKKAWELVKTATVDTKISGVTFGKRQTAIEHLTHYEAEKISISLSRDVANEYDVNAVENKGSYTIGYLPKTLSALIAPVTDKVKATFKEVRGKYQAYHNYGLVVGLSI